MDTVQELRDRVKTRLKMRLAELTQHAAANGGGQAPSQDALKEQLRQALRSLPPREHRLLQISRHAEEEAFLQEVFDEVLGGDPLAQLLKDDSISEVMINGPNEVFVERAGRLERSPLKFANRQHLLVVLERLLDSLGLSVTETNPVCDAQLPDGSRINVIVAPVVLGGPVITVRRKSARWSMADYQTTATLSEQMAQFLEACVRAKVNIVISGGTSSGKTTLVSILSTYFGPDERLITIENVPELDLPNREHWIRLISRPANLEGRGEIPLRVLVKNALRMRPDRIILGEARGEEALDVVQAMHTGHDGFLTVLHANSAQAALERLQMLMLMSGLDVPPATCQLQIASAVDLVVHMARFVDGSRRVASVMQVLGVSDRGFQLEELFKFQTEGFSPDGRMQGGHVYTGARPKFLDKFRFNNVEVPSWVTQ
jgi:pilus assembly protein CpaF